MSKSNNVPALAIAADGKAVYEGGPSGGAYVAERLDNSVDVPWDAIGELEVTRNSNSSAKAFDHLVQLWARGALRVSKLSKD
jgi:hypothetical protein